MVRTAATGRIDELNKPRNRWREAILEFDT
jgi:hypothetical protein